jgi:hypothetical protein
MRLPSRSLRVTHRDGWLEVVREHPVAQIGVAVGVGWLIGAASRALDRRAPALSAGDHFAEGSRKTMAAGRSLLAVGTAWAARHLSKSALREYGETARTEGARWTEQMAEKLEKALH